MLITKKFNWSPTKSPGPIFGQSRKLLRHSNCFDVFENSFLYNENKYDASILNKHLFLLIFRPRADFLVEWVKLSLDVLKAFFFNIWMRQFTFFDVLSLHLMNFPTIYDMTILNEQPFLVFFGPGQVLVWGRSIFFGLKTIP